MSNQQATAAIPHRADRQALVALGFALLTVAVAAAVMWQLRQVLIKADLCTALTDAALVAAVALAAVLLWPAFKSVRLASTTRARLISGEIVEARIANAGAREWASLTFGYGAASLIAFGFTAFLISNDVAVGKTFFFLPLMWAKWPLVVYAFWNNVFMFVIAEALVLAWGLVVAIARLMPGPAGRPIRALAIIYCDVFRRLPAVVTLYLVGFGLPLSGFVPTEIPGFGRVPLTWWAILALTLTYGAYVGEVYRAGIDSIHWSQWAAARSLGLSYFQTLRHVIVPQAIRRILAPLLNDFIGLQKDTALVNVIGVVDAFNQSKIISSNAFNLSAVTIVAILFVLITVPQARFVDRMIERDNRRTKAGG